MYVSIPINAKEKNEYIEYYESTGMTLHEIVKIDKNTLELVFSCDKSLGAQIIQHDSQAKGTIVFADGSSSPLYVRRNRNHDD